jgi:hypothetical protein
MFIVSIFALAVISIALAIVAIALRSRSVAILNFVISLASGVPIQPWATFSLHPPTDPDMRMNWLGALIWSGVSIAAVCTLVYCLIITMEKRNPKRPVRRKRRRRRRSRRELFEEQSSAQEGEGNAENDTFTDSK